MTKASRFVLSAIIGIALVVVSWPLIVLIAWCAAVLAAVGTVISLVGTALALPFAFIMPRGE